jgi:hypothetical protein
MLHDGLAEALLATVKPVPAAAPGAQMLKVGRDLLRSRELTRLALMTGLPARLAQRLLRALARQRPTLLRVNGGSRDGGTGSLSSKPATPSSISILLVLRVFEDMRLQFAHAYTVPRTLLTST